jgi:hypothetical protein
MRTPMTNQVEVRMDKITDKPEFAITPFSKVTVLVTFNNAGSVHCCIPALKISKHCKHCQHCQHCQANMVALVIQSTELDFGLPMLFVAVINSHSRRPQCCGVIASLYGLLVSPAHPQSHALILRSTGPWLTGPLDFDSKRLR